jgi:hypothetical protein
MQNQCLLMFDVVDCQLIKEHDRCLNVNDNLLLLEVCQQNVHDKTNLEKQTLREICTQWYGYNKLE